MPAIALPRMIQEKLDDLALQVRRLRLYRGISRVVVLAIASAMLGILADRAFSFSSSTRWIVTASWFGLVLVSVWRFVLVPMRRTLSRSELAAAIETQYPSLSERLSTIVELSQAKDGAHGSKPLMDLLIRETAHRTKRLDFERAAPNGAALRGALIAGVLIGVGLAAVLFVSGGSSRVKRFLLPWHTPSVEAPFAIRVSSGSVIIKRGEPLTLTAYLERKQPEAVLPTTAVLIAKDKATQTEKKLPMTGDSQAAFHVTWPAITSDFDYRVEAGSLASDWYSVTVTDAVELAPGTQVTIVPPEYAVPPLARTTLAGLGAVDGLQHSQIELAFKFNRPAASVTLEFQGNAGEKVRTPVTLAEDRRGATAKVTLITSGTLRLAVTNEQGVVTSLTAPVKAIIDTAPRFEKAVGISDRGKSVKPAESIILEMTVVDDFKIDTLSLEYELNKGGTVTVPLKLKDVGSPRVDGKHVFALAGLVKEGDTLLYRLKATDSRRVAGLMPQVVYFPEKEWAKLDITESAESLDKQDILTQRDAIQKKFEEAQVAAHEARRLTEQVLRGSGEKPMLTPEQVANLQSARDAAAKAEKALADAAKDAALTPELRGLAESIRAAANDTVQAADDLLRRSGSEPTPKGRSTLLADAEKKLVEARGRIEQLMARNGELAKNRLDKRRLEKLADEVSKLAAAAEKATDPKSREDLLQKLQKAKDELRDVVKGNDALRNGAENAANEQARKLSEEAAKLRDEQRKLAEDVARTEAEARRKALEGSAKTQDDVNERAREMRDRTAGPARLTGTDPLAKEPFDAAGEKIRNGDPVGAMTEQEKAARELERLASSLEKAAKERIEPREAARQLAKLQDDLRTRLTEAVKKPMSDAKQKRFADEQDAIRKALDKLETPPDDSVSAREKALALELLRAASEAVANNPRDAAEAQKEAAAAIRKFAEKLPSREARMTASVVELEKMMREQESLAREIEAKLKPYERRKPDEFTQRELTEKLVIQAKLQEKIAEKLAALDAPGYEARRDRTAQAATRAAEDLRKGLPQDIPASQADLRRRMIQLRVALSGGVPSDALADELARLQNRVAERLANGNSDAATLGELQKTQREIADRVGGINDPESAERVSRAKTSTEDAARQFQNANDVEELRRKTAKAAKDLDELADHLGGVEADRERIDRLAKSRRERAEQSKASNGKPVPADVAAAAMSELERELEDLKRTRAGTAQEAKKAAVDALERLKRTPNPERAPAVQKDAADALDQLAKKMPGESKRGERCTNDGDTSGDAGGQLPSKKDAAEARALAEEQRSVRDQTSKAASAAKPDAKTAEVQEKEQKDLAEKAQELSKKLDAAAHASTHGEPSATKLTEAAEAAKKAGEQMEKASREQAAGRPSGAGEARTAAEKSLEEAKGKAGSAGGGSGQTPDGKAAAASKSAEEAGGHLRAAGQQPEKAGEPLKKAAEKIGEAADRLGETGQEPGQSVSGGNAGNAAKPLTTADLPPDLQQYAGKPWGDLPGDVKARIIQDLKAKYGEDYARVIKLYFEQLADRK